MLFVCAMGVAAEETIAWKFPQEAEIQNGRMIIHSPQVIEWPGRTTTRVLMAVEYHPAGEGESTIYATVEMTGKTEINVDERIVTITDREVTNVKVAGKARADYVDKLSTLVRDTPVVAQLDIFLLSVAQDVLEIEDHEGFNPEPPQIIVATAPTILLSVQGELQFKPMESSPYSLVLNASWPLLKHRAQGKYFLLYKQGWWTTDQITGTWQQVDGQLPGLDSLDSQGEFKDFLVEPEDGEEIVIHYVQEPTELLVLDGPPSLEKIPEATGLSFAANTQSPLFYYGESWYFLVSGRWFTTDNLDGAAWHSLTELPTAFSDIPATHGMGYVRVSVAGTLEAKTALLEASLPQKKTTKITDRLELSDQYDGEPRFQRIPSTSVLRASNSPYDIFELQGVYYLCYIGAWYQADNAIGPWAPAFRVPDVIYDIPAESPSYPVTQVTVTQSTPTTVTYSATSSYYTGIYSYYGMPVYGTGWYYPPCYGSIWLHPRYVSYGHGSFYNPRTGNYGTRSVWYGPYGGYSYNEHYSPRSGRYGYVGTAWDSDEWRSYGETYNPRTDVYTETERYYSDDKERMEMERKIEKDGKTMDVSREVDFNDGWSVTDRSTSEGGSMHVERRREDDGSYTSEGTITGKDGQSATFEGTIEDGQRRTHYEGSDGGEMMTGGDGHNRGMVGRDDEGNLYAGHNGDVYKKSGDDWYQYDRDDGWSEMPAPEKPQNENQWKNKAETRTETRGKENIHNTGLQSASKSGSYSSYNRDSSSRISQLNRDAYSRNAGNQQFQQRRSFGSNRTGSGRMSGGFGRRR